MNVKLGSNEELVFSETKNGGKEIKISLIDGKVESFGISLSKSTVYKFKIPCFFSAIEDSVVQVDNKFYVVQNTDNYYSSLYKELQNLKLLPNERIIIVGDTDTGKSTLCQFLSGVFLEKFSKREQIFIDFDVGQNVYLPGCITLTKCSRTNQPDSNKLFKSAENMVFFFGHNTPGRDGSRYISFMPVLEKCLTSSSKEEGKRSGCIINTCGWVQGFGLKLLKKMTSLLKIDTVIVINNKKVFGEFQKAYGGKIRNILHLKRNMNVKKRGKKKRKNDRLEQIREYFYGAPSNPVKSYLVVKKFSDLMVFYIEHSKVAKSSTPVGKKSSAKFGVSRIGFLTEESTNVVMNAVMAVSHGRNESEVLKSNVFGFVCCSKVDIKNQTVTLIACKPELPSNVLLIGSISMPSKK